MTRTSEPLLCRRCGRVVSVSAEEYRTFEEMHYVCFHYEYEHDPFDPDQECEAGGCPSGALSGGRNTVVDTARGLAAQAATGPSWTNDDLTTFLGALAAWIDDCDTYYTDRNRVRPSNAWEIVNDALQEAAGYR